MNPWPWGTISFQQFINRVMNRIINKTVENLAMGTKKRDARKRLQFIGFQT